MTSEEAIRNLRKEMDFAAKLISYGNDARRKELEDFLEKYKHAYTKEERINIKKHFLTSYNDIMTQIYCALGILEEKDSPYYHLAKLIEKDFGVDRKILEVGGGRYPALAIEIARLQKKKGKGSITVMDPIILDGINPEGVTLLKKKLTAHTKLDNYDLVIAKEPCDATETIIESCRSQNKSLFLSPCDCPHLYEGLEYSSFDWYNYIISSMRKINGEFINHEETIPHYFRPIYSKVLK